MLGAVAVAMASVVPAFASPEAPVVEPASGVFATTAVVHGVLDPASGVYPVEAGSYQFLYKATKVATKAECESAGASAAPVSPGMYFGNEPEAVSESLSGLTPETEYVVCLAAMNGKGETTVSAPVSFETLAGVAPQAPQAIEASEVRASSATLVGVLDPLSEGEPGSYRFVYRQSASECTGAGVKETTQEPASGASPLTVSTAVTGLLAGKTYSFCVKAFNALGEATLSPPAQFTTTTPPETPVSEAAGEVTAATASLHGELNPGKEAETGYHFLYSTTGVCAAGTASEQVAVSELPAKTKVEAALTGLEPHQSYTACVVASDAAGDEVPGNEVSFKTSAVPPGITGETASTVTFNGASLEAQVNPNNQETTYSFEYSTEAAGEVLKGTITSVPGGGPLSGFGAQPASVTTGTLTQDTTYFYRVSAENTEGEETKGRVQRFTTLPETPENVEVSEITGSTAKLEGVLNPGSAGEAGASYEFLYEPSETECENASRMVGDSKGQTPEPVQAQLTGLVPNTKYSVCLRARNGGEQTATSSPPVTFATLPTPILESESSSNETISSADVHANVNPDGSELESCVFEYGTSTAYEAQAVACQPSLKDIGAGSTPVPVSATLTGLSANTTYHWRITARNASGTSSGVDHTFIVHTVTGSSGACPDETVREQDHSTALPDCRSYEMVTPPQKNGALISSLFGGGLGVPQIAKDGADVTAISLQCLAGSESCTGIRAQEGEPYEFARTSQGWVTHPLAPPATQYGITTEWAASADEHTTLFSALSPTEEHDNFYLRTANNPPTEIGPVSENGGAIQRLDIGGPPVEATSDFSHMLFASNGGLWSLNGFPENNHSIYEYSGQGNTKPLSVGVSGAFGSTTRISECPTFFGGVEENQPDREFGSLSADGHVAFFTALGHSETGKCSGGAVAPPTNELFERVDGETPGVAHTVLVSAPTPAGCSSVACQAAQSEPQDAEFEGASSDGSRVLFTSAQQLSDNASQGEGVEGRAGSFCHAAGGAGCNLYESVCAQPCGSHGEEPAAKERELVDVSEAEGSKPAAGGPRVQGVMAISPDGSHVYFVARGKLADNQGAMGSVAVDGQENLYVYAAGQPLRFIATLPPADEERFIEGSRREWDEGISLANVTPDGRFLVFLSHAALTADDTRPVGGPTQIYRYDAQSAQLVRVSVGQDGFNDNGNAGGTSEQAEPGIVPAAFGWQERPGAVRADPTMSDDGQYVFFDSPVALAPGALNEVPVNKPPPVSIYAENVYEYHDGSVSLISDGRDSTPNSSANGVHTSTRLLGADESGRNVFFATNDQLTSQDTDTDRDYYDARVCQEADPCLAPPASPGPGCQGEACQTPAAAPAAAVLGGSSTLQGTGNLADQPGSVAVHLTVLTRSVHGVKFNVRLKPSAAGRVTITASLINKVSRSLKAGAQTIQISLTAAARRALHHKHKLTVKLHIAYTPTGGRATASTATITIRP